MEKLSNILTALQNDEITVTQAFNNQQDCFIEILKERQNENHLKYESFNGRMNGFGVSSRLDGELINIILNEPDEYSYGFRAIQMNLIIFNGKTMNIEETHDSIISNYIQLFNILKDTNNEIYEEYCRKTNNVMHNSSIKVMELEKLITIFEKFKLNS